MSAPIAFDCLEDGAMVAVYPKIAAKQFEPGQRYLVVPYEARSTASHNHEFAWLSEAWKNLPEAIAAVTPTPEHLRKRALIETGFYDETVVDAGTQASALRVAAFMRGSDDLAMIVTRGSLVVRRTAKSQSRRAMDHSEFQGSKTAIMEWVSALIGVSSQTLQANAARAA